MHHRINCRSPAVHQTGCAPRHACGSVRNFILPTWDPTTSRCIGDVAKVRSGSDHIPPRRLLLLLRYRRRRRGGRSNKALWAVSNGPSTATAAVCRRRHVMSRVRLNTCHTADAGGAKLFYRTRNGCNVGQTSYSSVPCHTQRSV